MRFMSKAFRRTAMYSCQCVKGHSGCPMPLDWLLDDLDIPETARTLWFEFMEKPTEDSISVSAELEGDSVDLWVREKCSGIYLDEFAGKDGEKLEEFLENKVPFSQEDMHLQVHYRE